MTVLYAGIDVSKDKFDVSFTTNGKRIFGYSAFTNEKKGIKSFFKKALILMKKENYNKIHFIMESTEIFLKLFSLKPVVHSGFALVFTMAFANRVLPVHNFATIAVFVNIYKNILTI